MVSGPKFLQPRLGNQIAPPIIDQRPDVPIKPDPRLHDDLSVGTNFTKRKTIFLSCLKMSYFLVIWKYRCNIQRPFLALHYRAHRHRTRSQTLSMMGNLQQTWQVLFLKHTRWKRFEWLFPVLYNKNTTEYLVQVIGWFKRSLHFALFQPDRRWDIFRNGPDHWGMVTYNFFRNFF